ncbi:darcynin family protein [Hydrogenophaga sp.]|uniref:darcynin family protein n=1 Tax=Hydrogenophaga sp. TaxID=1904254 RepID=UPI0035625B6F
MNYSFFVLLRALPAWLALSREARKALGDEHLGAALASHRGRLTMRYFDAEAFTAPCSDVMMIETQDPKHHYYFMEQLRDSPLFSVPYFELLNVITTIEDGYQAYEATSQPASDGTAATETN